MLAKHFHPGLVGKLAAVLLGGRFGLLRGLTALLALSDELVGLADAAGETGHFGGHSDGGEYAGFLASLPGLPRRPFRLFPGHAQ